MTSKLIVNSLAADTGVSTITFADQAKMGNAIFHSTGFTIGDSFLHSTGVNITNINATGVITATKFVGEVSVGSSITFEDNEKAYFGTSTDFSIYHNGSASYLDETGTGGLIAKTNTAFQVFNSAGSQAALTVIPGAQVELYHNTTKVLETKGYGIDITGGFVATGDCSIADKITHAGDLNTAIRFPAADTFSVETGGNERVRITSSQTRIGSQAATDTTSYEIQLSGAANNDAILSLYNPTTNNGEGIQQGFFFKNSNDTVTEFARIESTAIETTAATAKGDLRFHTRSGSAGFSNASERLRITQDGNALFGGSAVSQTNRQLALGSNAEANFAIETHNNAFSESSNIRFYKSRGTAASPTAVADGHYISQLMFYGHDGTDYANAAGYMRVLVDGTVASNQVPGQIQIGVNDGSSATTAMTIHKTGSVLFTGLTDKNDPRNAEGIAIKSPSGISIQNFGANGSHNWRIRPDDLTAWGTLEFSVSPTSNSTTDWPDASSDVVLTLQPNKDVKVNNGNLVIGTAGKGIDFSAASNVGGMTSELLDDYEEGSFSPTLVNGNNGYRFQQGTYTKVGNLVTFTAYIETSATPPSGNLAFGGLPFTSIGSRSWVFPFHTNRTSFGTNSFDARAYLGGTDTNVYIYYPVNSSSSNFQPINQNGMNAANASAVWISGSYQTAS